MPLKILTAPKLANGAFLSKEVYMVKKMHFFYLTDLETGLFTSIWEEKSELPLTSFTKKAECTDLKRRGHTAQ